MIASSLPARTRRCITPGCGALQQARGVCEKCYQAAKRMIWKGVANNEQLVSLGLLLPHKTGKGSTGESRFLQEFNKRVAHRDAAISKTDSQPSKQVRTTPRTVVVSVAAKARVVKLRK